MGKARGLRVTAGLAVVLVLGLTMAGPVMADETIRARLQGYNEVPAISTSGIGEFRGKISKDESTIDYELGYEGLLGTVTMSHIHVGQRGVSGGISAWLCQTASNAAPAAVSSLTPTCPAPSGSVQGILSAANVIGPSGQGITTGEFAELVKAIRAGVAYVNVHSKDAGSVATSFNTGEIRGQLRASRSHHGDWD